MPAIHLFQKRTLLGGDDLQVPAAVTIAARIMQGLLFILPQIWWLLHEAHHDAHEAHRGHSKNWFWAFVLMDPVLKVEGDDDNENDDANNSSDVCQNAHVFPLLTSMYLGASVLFGLASMSLEYRLIIWSSQGTPTRQRQPRTSNVQALLECKLLKFSIALAIIVMTYLVAAAFGPTYLDCQDQLDRQQQDQQRKEGQEYSNYNDDGIDDDQNDLPEQQQRHHWIGTKWWWSASALLVASQAVEVMLAGLFWIRLVQVDRFHTAQQRHRHRHHDDDDDDDDDDHQSQQPDPHEMSEELWADRCHWMCQCLSVSTCFLFGGQDLMRTNHQGVPYYEHLSRALADYLETKGTLDVVPTDLLTGLLVLQRLQRQRLLQARLQIVRSMSQTRLSLLPPGMRRDRSSSSPITTIVDRPILRPTMSDIPMMQSPRTKSPLTLRRSRGGGGSTNELHRSSTTPTHATTSTTTMSITHNTSASSLDLPETARLVNHSPPSMHPIYRRLKYTTQSESPLLSTTMTPATASLHPQLSSSSPQSTHPTISPDSSSSPRRRQRQAYYEAQSRAVLNPHNPADVWRLQEGARMAKYALCIYTWMLYLFVHPISGVPRLACRSCRLCQCCRPATSSSGRRRQRRRRRRFQEPRGDSLLDERTGETYASTPNVHDDQQYPGAPPTSTDTIIGDNICGWHKQSLLLVAGLEHDESDLIYAQFVNRFSLVPYCILVDHATQSVVVSIRGSLSLDDLVTDVHIDPECIADLGQQFGFDATDQYCHAGVLASARNVYADLQRHQLLEQVLLPSSSSTTSENTSRSEDVPSYPEYHLRLVGHSLGAGVATLLGYMLQPTFPSLRVFNFSPPGCTMTWDLATRCEPWATTFVLDSDIVPRLSVVTLERLRNEVLELVGRLKVPKYQVVESFWNVRRSRRSCVWGTSPTGMSTDHARNDRHNVTTPMDDNDHAAEDLNDLTQLIDEWLLDDEALEPHHQQHQQDSTSSSLSSSSMMAHLDDTNDGMAGTTYHHQLLEFRHVQEERKQRRGARRQIQLYPPGRMIQLLKTGEAGGCGPLLQKVATCCTSNAGFQYSPVYLANDDLDEIVVSPTMATDHFVDRIVDELTGLAKQYQDTAAAAADTVTTAVGEGAGSGGADAMHRRLDGGIV